MKTDRTKAAIEHYTQAIELDAERSTCVHLASLLMPHYGVGPFGRNALARGDADVGAFDRAMVGALNVADPTARASAIALILRRAIDKDDLDWAELAQDHLRQRSETTDGVRWMAELKLKQNSPSMVSLKQWAESLRPSSESAMALAGIAVGLQKRGDSGEESTSSDETDDARGGLAHERPNSIEQLQAFAEQGDHLATAEVFASLLHEHRKNSQVREIFDRSAASVPRWWMEQALALPHEVEDPLLQGTIWRQLAVAQKDLGDENGVGPALKRSIFAIIACWCELDKKRGQAQRSYKGSMA